MKRYALTALLACGLYGTTTASAAEMYFVNNAGEIRSFTGVSAGATPVDGNAFGDGVLQTTVSAYGAYQGFTSTPDGKVYGVNGSGGVDSWSSIASWLAGDAATSESTGVYGAGSGVAGGLHGISYDANTGGFYVIVEGAPTDGRLREFTTLNDFINNTNFTENTTAAFGGNILALYYPDEDAPASATPNADAEAGSNYLHVTGGGVFEGWTTLDTSGFGMFGGPDTPGGNGGGSNRSYQNGTNFGSNVVGGFSVVIPEPTSLALLGLGGLCMLSRRRR